VDTKSSWYCTILVEKSGRYRKFLAETKSGWMEIFCGNKKCLVLEISAKTKIGCMVLEIFSGNKKLDGIGNFGEKKN